MNGDSRWRWLPVTVLVLMVAGMGWLLWFIGRLALVAVPPW